MGGGTSAMSGGLVYLGGGTPIQTGCGYSDTPEDMERFLAGRLRTRCRRRQGPRLLPGQRRPLPLARRPRRAVRGRASSPNPAASRLTTPVSCSPVARTRGRSPTSHRPSHVAIIPKFPDAAGGFLMQRLIEALRRDNGARRDRRARRATWSPTTSGWSASRPSSTVRPAASGRGEAWCCVPAGSSSTERSSRSTAPSPCGARSRSALPSTTAPASRWAGGPALRSPASTASRWASRSRRPARWSAASSSTADGRRFINEDTYAGRLGQEFLLRQDGEVYFVHDDSTFAVEHRRVEAQLGRRDRRRARGA